MMNPAARLDFVTVRGTRGRTAPQGFEDGRLRLADAGKQRIVQGAPGIQTEGVSLDGNAYPTPLQLG
jgi:hypothetical protein